MQSRTLNTNYGFSYLEVVITMTLIASLIVGINSIFGVGIQNDKKAENIIVALGLAQELMEELKAEDFSTITNSPRTSIGFFSRQATVIANYQGNVDRKLVTVTVSGPEIADLQLRWLVCNNIL